MHANITGLRSSLSSKKLLQSSKLEYTCDLTYQKVKFLLRDGVVREHRHRSDCIVLCPVC
jgi:hypothetical protein